MSPIIIILLLLGGLWLATKLIDGFSDAVGHFFQRLFDHAIGQRVERLRAEARRSGRPVGSPPSPTARWHAGAVDLGLSALAGALVTLAVGLSEVTEYSYETGASSTHFEEHFSIPILLLFTAVVYAAASWGTALTAHSQSPGQQFSDYAPRRTDGREMSGSELLKRHLLRFAAAPAALLATLQGSEPAFEHDEWTETTVGILGGVESDAPAENPHMQAAGQAGSSPAGDSGGSRDVPTFAGTAPIPEAAPRTTYMSAPPSAGDVRRRVRMDELARASSLNDAERAELDALLAQENG